MTNELNDLSDAAALAREQARGLFYKLEKLYEKYSEMLRKGE